MWCAGCGGAIGLLCHVDSRRCLVRACVGVVGEQKRQVWWGGAIGHLCCVNLRWHLPEGPSECLGRRVDVPSAAVRRRMRPSNCAMAFSGVPDVHE